MPTVTPSTGTATRAGPKSGVTYNWEKIFDVTGQRERATNEYRQALQTTTTPKVPRTKPENICKIPSSATNRVSYIFRRDVTCYVSLSRHQVFQVENRPL